MEAPTINTGPVTSLSAAKDEYRKLKALLEVKEGFPQGGTGWAQSVLNRINDRMNWLRIEITDEVCFKEQNHE